ncbi:MAG: methyltransferase family protein, partial [bacterium]
MIVLIILARPDWMHLVWGAPLIVGGAALRIWAAGTIKKQQTLAQEGPYALMRHPLYFGSFLGGLG